MTTELKDRVRCWFECLRLAHRSTEPVVMANLKAGYYLDWGDYRHVAFTPWWNAHKHLFQESPRSRRLKVGDVVPEDEFVISIPFVFPPTSVGKMVKEMYGREFSKRVLSDRKQKRKFEGRYELTGELRISRMRYYLIYLSEVYFDFFEREDKVSAKTILKHAEKVFEKHKIKFESEVERKKATAQRRKKTNRSALPKDDQKIPFLSTDDDPESRRRLVIHYNKRCRNLLINVSRGVFPGRI